MRYGKHACRGKPVRFPAAILFFLTVPVVAGAVGIPRARAYETRMVSTSEEVVVADVTEFGVLPDDAGDDTEGVRKAIEALAGRDRPVLRFPAGRYRFAGDPDPKSGRRQFVFRNLNDLVVDGGGAEFVFSGYTSPFVFVDCRNVEIRNFRIDWDRPSFSPGVVVGRGENRLDVEIDDGYPVEAAMPVESFQEFDPATRLPKAGGTEMYWQTERTELIRPQLLRIHLKNPVTVPVGARLLLRHRVYGYNALFFLRCRDVRVYDVTVHTVPGMGMVAKRTRDITVERFRVLLPPGSDRLMTTTADGTHFAGCRGTIRLRDCEFERMGDDAVNIKSGLYITFRKRIDERTIAGVHNLGLVDLPDPGDEMEFRRASTLLPFATRTVETAELEGKVHRVRFTEPLPEGLEPGDVVGNASRTPRVRISNVTVRDNRARGFLLQTRDVVVEDCRFERCTTAGIFVMTEIVHFFESIAPRDVVIRNCVIRDCGYAPPYQEGVLMVYAYLKDFAFPPEPGLFRNIVIENTTVEGGRGAGIFVAGADGITLRGNVVRGMCAAPGRPESAAAIYIMSSRNVVLEGNRVRKEEQADGCEESLRLGPGCDTKTFTVRNNEGMDRPR